ncbi:conserved hypothetical protein [Nitrosococcus halophilus Nc 4]|uniref:Nitroreductase n=1 Tax=Nitrosococcus halophilus (strain Nc4) TaxID=472759 RepID=D5C4F0_NITHN|nr:SagB/ThcOx family dehydrogenase [Nitrosococcus halophilus]ADE15134.1 conserved hypothetical protein [Nitrosococcus halophilus Nc 4]
MDKPQEKTAPDRVRQYHQRSKHHLNRYARGPGGLDWATQPDPFRRYEGCDYVDLPLTADSLQTPYPALYRPQAIPPQPLTLETVAALFELSFGISAWKQYGESRWALRCNPSSGNLHPTEAYGIFPNLAGLPGGVYHYVSYDHRLEQRCRFPPNSSEPSLPEGALLVGLSSIHWREAWKYGERAYRYCQHDVGHALAAVAYAAATLGWSVRLLPHWSDDDIATLLGLNREADYRGAEQEHPDLVLLVGPNLEGFEALPPESWLAKAAAGQWQGQANALSPHHRFEWPIIEEVAEACRKPPTQETPWCAPPLPEPLPTRDRFLAAHLIRQRRSAQALDGVTAIPAPTFFRMLEMTLPRPGCPPWMAWPWAPRIHLALFVHRVEGLSPGLYLLMRRPDVPLQTALGEEFLWQRPDHCPDHLALYQLVEGDARRAAGIISCHQAIAADGAFSLGMIGEFEEALDAGPWGYRRLFWEAGLIGQILYLEAEAAGVRGTGIGCYFDDALHQTLGLRGTQFQSMYHFTLGGPLEDTRLQTLPPYAHLPERRRA